MKKKVQLSSVIAASILLAAGIQAGAAHVDLQGGVCQLPLMRSMEEGAGEQTHTVTDFGILGYQDENTLIIATPDGVGYISVDKLKENFPTLEITELPTMEGTSTYGDGTSYADGLVPVQQALIDLGYLDGSADGGYGPMTKGAVEKFQAENGLEVTGVVDPITNWLACDAVGNGESITVEFQGEDYTPEQKFAAIFRETDADLSNYMDARWRFSFDPFVNRGFINPNVQLANVEQGESDLDRMNITVSLNVMCALDYVTEYYSVKPVFEVVYTGAYRPYVKGAMFNVGSEATYLKDVVSESELSGINVIETSYITLDNAVLKHLKDENVKSATLRLMCQDENLDVTLDLSDIWCRDLLPDSVDDEEDYFAFGDEEAEE